MENKKKGLLAVACLSALAIGLTVGFVEGQPKLSKETAIISTNVVRQVLDERDEGGATPDNAFYVIDYTWEDDYSKQWFVGNNDDVWIRFYQKDGGGDEIGHADLNLGNQITFSMDYDWHARRVVAGIVPKYTGSVTAWTGAVLVRQTSGLSEIKWSGTDHHNQTADIALSNSKTINTIRVNSESDVGYDKWISAAGRIEKWAAKADEWTSTGVCVNSESGPGDTNTSTLSASWARTATTFGSLGADVQAFFSRLEANEGGSTSEDLAARYDHIMTRYGVLLSLENFASR